jgi:urease accessory protein UreF
MFLEPAKHDSSCKARLLSCVQSLLPLAFGAGWVHRKPDKARSPHLKSRWGGLPRDMVEQRQVALSDPSEWFGDWHPLAKQLGSADGLSELGSVSATLRLRPVKDAASLGRFLRDYHARILLPIELRTIQSAHGHASRNEIRELVALDRSLASEAVLSEFAPASQRIGQMHLKKLRPLSDHRLLQRYLKAVENGQAKGWHTLVYGLTLAIYSLPLRQGLMGYAHQTTRGFICSAARSLSLPEGQRNRLFDNLSAGFPGAIEEILRPSISKPRMNTNEHE